MPQVLHGQFRLGKLRQRGDLITRRQVAQMVGTITPDESGIPLPWVACLSHRRPECAPPRDFLPLGRKTCICICIWEVGRDLFVVRCLFRNFPQEDGIERGKYGQQ